jgi:hypothetical protein
MVVQCQTRSDRDSLLTAFHSFESGTKPPFIEQLPCYDDGAVSDVSRFTPAMIFQLSLICPTL